MSPYIAYVQSLSPKLKYYELAVVRSDPKVKSQYQGNGNDIVFIRTMIALWMHIHRQNNLFLFWLHWMSLRSCICRVGNIHERISLHRLCNRDKLWHSQTIEVDLPHNRVYNFNWEHVNEDESDDKVLEREHKVEFKHSLWVSKIEDYMLTRICNESSKPWTWQSLDPEPGLTFLLIRVAEEDLFLELPPGLVSHGSGNSLQLLSWYLILIFHLIAKYVAGVYRIWNYRRIVEVYGHGCFDRPLSLTSSYLTANAPPSHPQETPSVNMSSNSNAPPRRPWPRLFMMMLEVSVISIYSQQFLCVSSFAKTLVNPWVQALGWHCHSVWNQRIWSQNDVHEENCQGSDSSLLSLGCSCQSPEERGSRDRPGIVNEGWDSHILRCWMLEASASSQTVLRSICRHIQAEVRRDNQEAQAHSEYNRGSGEKHGKGIFFLLASYPNAYEAGSTGFTNLTTSCYLTSTNANGNTPTDSCTSCITWDNNNKPWT